MHNKIIYARHLSTQKDDHETEDEDKIDRCPKLEAQSNGGYGDRFVEGRAWVYVGSANCSESAWGRLGKDQRTGREKLTCRNWECGVVIPVKGSARGKQDAGTGEGSMDSLDLFKGTVPVPMEYPGDEYGEKEPWFGA